MHPTQVESSKLKSSVAAVYITLAVLTALAFLSGYAIFHLFLLGANFEAGLAMRVVLASGLGLVLAQGVLVLRSLVARSRLDQIRLRELSSKLDQLQTIDETTKAYNRQMLEMVLGREVEHVRRYATQVVGIMFDVDGFRELNERFGYSEGDKILAQLATVIRRSIRKPDFLFRWRGGRFIVLASHVSLSQATQLAEKLRHTVAGTAFAHDIRLTISLGLTDVDGNDSLESFVGRLKKALSGAKELGRSQLRAVRAA